MSDTDQPGSKQALAKRIALSALAVAGVFSLGARFLGPSERDAAVANFNLFANVSNRDVAALKQAIVRDRDVVRMRDLDGNAPLHIAATLGWQPGVDVLIANGADVHAINAMGQPPLALALNGPRRERKDVVAALLKAGASADARLPNGKSVREFAAKLQAADPEAVALLSAASARPIGAAPR